MADFGRGFEELCKQADQLEVSKKAFRSDYSSGHTLEVSDLLNWMVKVRHLLSSVCGPTSQHFTQFVAAEKRSVHGTNYDVFQKLRAVLLAAKEDYEGGYLNSLKLLVQAEVFDSELEMASELLASGYIPAAAVTAGIVLEAGLREMCGDNELPIGNLNKMNADLAKAGVFNKLIQKQVTALADIRNNAAHGHYDQFSKEDVEGMIKDVHRLLANRTT